MIGRIYGEVTVRKDFFAIENDRIKFREVPSIGNSWLPISKEYMLDEIGKVDIVSVSTIFKLESKNIALKIIPKEGKYQIVGTRYSNDQLMQMGLALNGLLTLSSSLQKDLGINVESVSEPLKQIFDQAKNIWKSIRSDK